MPAHAPNKTPWLRLTPEFKGICKRSWQLWWSEMLTLLESLGTPAKTLRLFVIHFPLSGREWKWEMLFQFPRAAASPPEDGHPQPTRGQEDLPKLHLWCSPSASHS